jgi:hypothetical protein
LAQFLLLIHTVVVLIGKADITVELVLAQAPITAIKHVQEYVPQLRKKQFQQRNQSNQDKQWLIFSLTL